MLSVLIRFRGEKKKEKAENKSQHMRAKSNRGEKEGRRTVYIYKRGVENPGLSTLSEGTTQTGGKRAERGEGDM
jgi:hypothetical protein